MTSLKINSDQKILRFWKVILKNLKIWKLLLFYEFQILSVFVMKLDLKSSWFEIKIFLLKGFSIQKTRGRLCKMGWNEFWLLLYYFNLFNQLKPNFAWNLSYEFLLNTLIFDI